MFARCGLYSIAYLHMFSGGELWTTHEPARDRSGVCKTMPHTDIKGLHCLHFDIDHITVFGFQSDHR